MTHNEAKLAKLEAACKANVRTYHSDRHNCDFTEEAMIKADKDRPGYYYLKNETSYHQTEQLARQQLVDVINCWLDSLTEEERKGVAFGKKANSFGFWHMGRFCVSGYTRVVRF